jgi:toxin ParE1/3/4
MKTPKYRISAKAVEDLEQIWVYTFNKWSAEQADRYYHLIIDEIEFISRDQSGGKSMDHIKEGYRVSIVKSHMIFFRRTGGITEIIRILHQKMDTESNLE